MRTIFRKLLVALPPALAVAMIASVPGESQEQAFRFKSKASDGCLHFRSASPTSGDIMMSNMCQEGPAYLVDRAGEALRIKVTQQFFVCLQVDLPAASGARVKAGDCTRPSGWSVQPPDENGFREIVLRSDAPERAKCLQEDTQTAHVVVDFCNERSKWKLERLQ